MGGKVLPKLKIISNWNYGELGWNVGMNTNLVKLDTLIQLYVQDKDLSSPPTSPIVGDTYIVGSSATGDWYGYDNYITLYKNIYNDDGSISGQEWVFYDPNEGWICWISDQSLFYYYTGSQWEPLLSSAGYITTADVTYENLNFNGDVGTGSNQVAQGDHNHTGVYLSTSHEGDTVTHGATGVIVGTLNIQTIENKTLTSPVINTPTINTPDIDGGTIDNTSIGSVTPSSGDFTTLTAATDPVDENGVGDRGYNDTRYLPMINQKAPVQAVHMTVASSGSNGIQISDDSDINFGTGDFTLVWKGSLSDYTPGSTQTLFFKYLDASNVIGLYVKTSGALRFSVLVGGSYLLDKTTTNTISSSDGDMVNITVSVTRESNSAVGTVNFYTNNTLLESLEIASGSPSSYDNTGSLFLSGTNTTRITSTTQASYLFNRALSASEVAGLYVNGIAYEDKWGSQTAQTSGTLTTGKNYIIDTFETGDDFTNVGAASNANGVEFTATGTTPTTWTNGSSLRRAGATLALEPENINATNWKDASTNALDATYPTTGWSLVRSTDVTYENLNTNSDIGTGSDQVAQGDHEHSVIEDQDGDTTFTYDDNDNILTITKVLTSGTITGTYIETFTYNEDLRVSEMNATLDGADYSKVEYTYDVSGNIVDYTYTRY